MKKLGIILLLLFSVLAFGAIPFKVTNNEIQMGNGDNTTAKSLEFLMGLGSLNPIFSSTDGSEMVINIPFRIEGNLNVDNGDITAGGNNISFGDGTNVDKFLNLAISGESVGWKYDQAAGEILVKKKAGDTYKKLGSGSGSGTGDGINGFGEDDNANAEDGTSAWTNVGGTFAVTTTDPLEGEQSFTYTPSAQGNYVESAVLDFNKDIFKGRSCEGRIEYIGGDENLTLKVINGDNEVLGSQVLPAHTVTASESVFFLCPSEAQIVADADKGNLRLRIENEGASASPLIKWDLSYLGTLRGLVETTLPDKFSAKISGSLGASVGIVSQSSDFITSVSKVSGGVFDINLKPGQFTVNPAAVAEAINTPARLASVESISSSTIRVKTFDDAGGIADYDFTIFVEKQGADAKQSVQVYKSIPKVSENINVFSAKVQGPFDSETLGTVADENVNWIDGNCSNANPRVCNFVPNIFNSLPNCTIGEVENATDAFIVSLSTSQISIQTNRSASAGTLGPERSFNLKCQKSSNDFKLPTVQPILIKQVETSIQGGVRIESCSVTNTGTPVFVPNRGCESWIDSLTDLTVGRTQLNIKSGIFSTVPNCTMSDNGDSSFFAGGESISTTSVIVRTMLDNSALSDRPFNVICIGER